MRSPFVPNPSAKGQTFLSSLNGPLIALGALVVLLLLFIVAMVAVTGMFNDYARLETRAKACELDNKNVLDNTRKSVRECAAVSDKEVAALLSIITGNSKARGANDPGEGQMVTVMSVREAVPSITEVSTLGKLLNIVVAARKDWQAAQTRLIAVKQEADTRLATFPSGPILRTLGKQPINITIITSAETDGNFATGRDDTQWVAPSSNRTEQ